MNFLKLAFKLLLIAALMVGAFVAYFYYQSQQHVSINTNPLIVNDVTGLNPVQVADVVKPKSVQDITDAIVATVGPISIGGARYSMGGQTAYPASLHLDMRDYDEVLEFDASTKQITVQTGITWREIQQLIDPHNLSIKIMQDFNNFTVGGALSVNAHGRYNGAGPIINSVKSIKIALANGSVYVASREKNNALFYGAIGGYGALGVITEVTLELVDNIRLERSVTQLAFHDFIKHFKSNVLNNESVVLQNALLYPPSYESVRDISWSKTDKELTSNQRLQQKSSDAWWKPVVFDLFASSNFLKRIRQNLVDPFVYDQEAVVWLNWEASYDLHEYGFVANSDTTLAMREYFVPADEFEIFVLKMRDVFIRHEVDVLNISVRYSPKDPGSLLAWANEDVFSFVVSYRQGKDEESLRQVADWSNQLIQAAVESGGSYYMPFQIFDSQEHFSKAYPNAGYFFNLKKEVDPDNRFNNMLMLELYPENRPAKAMFDKLNEDS